MTVHYKTDNQKPALLRVPASSNVVQKLGLSPINIVAEVKNHVKCNFLFGGGAGTCTPRTLGDNPSSALRHPHHT